MAWDTRIQDYIVYVIVGATAIYLLFPFFSSLKGLFGKSDSEEIRYGCYEDACASCRVVPVKKESTSRKAKRA
ncbi:hypothetical protein LEP1GSC058_1110 [Leptospira fainei serovar Hurstbridge str. BUT 6]|uniref:Uncharacterized protein n=1 Tax=Leptospira fainei serovar Hurstbridge str. BUT 6 TaxID=1193011 RepID=S3VWJ7_9LEPT|nr:hypothetical protein [Leptospira fainei]EPG72492.1 hypothetical protein LEP1GSC058_1110 [Leptospira fainei serovar Hurstbridge str. BUT 6]